MPRVLKKKPQAHFLRKLHKHFKTDPSKLAVIASNFAVYQRPNIQLACDELFSGRGIESEVEGVVAIDTWDNPTIAKLTRDVTSRRFVSAPVEHQDVPLADGKRLACVTTGIHWVLTRDEPVAMLLTESKQSYPPRITVEVVARTLDVAQQFGRDFVKLVEKSPAFRGQVLSLSMDCHHQVQIHFHKLPEIRREEIVLPAQVLERIDRQAIGFVRHAARLKQAGRHLKRGVLLHGPPGTGKTLSAMYLASLLPGRTVMILTGGGISAIEATGALARALAPVTVILEDVDLIGTMREHQSVSANALLFELLNQMDGLAEDADVLFVLTTNRPDVLEPALASRPGRIDQAIEVPVPDEDCRRRLFALYGKGLDLQMNGMEKLVTNTKGVSAAFIRELLRRSAILSVESSTNQENSAAIAVNDTHVEEALAELMQAGGRFTQVLLGVQPSEVE